MFQNHTNTSSSFGELVDNTLLEIWQTAGTRSLSALKHDDRSAVLVIYCVEPVTKGKGRVRVRLIHGLIVEMVYRDGQGVCRVKSRGIDITAQ